MTTTSEIPPALREAAEHVVRDGADYDNAAEALADNAGVDPEAVMSALNTAIAELDPDWFEVDDAVAKAYVRSVPGMGGTIRRATYEAHGAAAYGWGDTDQDALASLRRCLAFNLRNNGKLL